MQPATSNRMPPPLPALPSDAPLSGSDYFMHVFDHSFRRHTGRGNICALTIFLPASLSRERITAHLISKRLLPWICSLRLHKKLFSFARWVPSSFRTPLTLEEGFCESIAALDRQISETDLMPGSSPFKVVFYRLPEQSALTFFWQHALFDAHGGELFCRYLLHERPEEPPLLTPRVEKVPFLKRIQGARKAARFIFKSAQSPIATVAPYKRTARRACYHRIDFSPEETGAIDSAAERVHASLFKSCFYLASTACALQEVQHSRGVAPIDFHVPIPHDCRRITATGPLVSNQLSFLFYRIRHHTLFDIKTCIDDLLLQAEQMVKSSLQREVLHFLSIAKILPRMVYQRLMLKPTVGSFASFFFSDTGESLSSFNDFLGEIISAAWHYPPNFYPPGFTVVFSRRSGRLGAVIVHAEGLMQPAELKLFEDSLRRNLMHS